MEIVVADDDPVMRALLEMKLTAKGHTVRIAADGHEALAQALTPCRTAPHLLVLDIAMPGLSGLEVTCRLRARPETAKLPIVLLSGRDSNADILAGWQAGADYYITKPLMIEQLHYFIDSITNPTAPAEPWDDAIV
jgi:DNA-binding response OmpR family regulator